MNKLINFIRKADKVHNGKYDYSKVIYQSPHTKIIIACPIHGEFTQTPNAHINNRSGCQKCFGNYRYSTAEMIEKFKIIHGDRYDYSKVDYVKSSLKIIIVCSVHGEFTQTPNNHLSKKQGCPKCKSSKGEITIRNWLMEHNIEFKEQHRFADCKDIRSLKFDFWLPKLNCVIEFDGEQHHRPISFSGDQSAVIKIQNLQNIQRRDNIKNEYCKQNNIILLRISPNSLAC